MLSDNHQIELEGECKLSLIQIAYLTFKVKAVPKMRRVPEYTHHLCAYPVGGIKKHQLKKGIRKNY